MVSSDTNAQAGKGAVIGTEGSITDAMACRGYAEGTRHVPQRPVQSIVFAYVWRCQQGNKTTFKLSEIKGPARMNRWQLALLLCCIAI